VRERGVSASDATCKKLSAAVAADISAVSRVKPAATTARWLGNICSSAVREEGNTMIEMGGNFSDSQHVDPGTRIGLRQWDSSQ
jgi:hypothetical protein